MHHNVKIDAGDGASDAPKSVTISVAPCLREGATDDDPSVFEYADVPLTITVQAGRPDPLRAGIEAAADWLELEGQDDLALKLRREFSEAWR